MKKLIFLFSSLTIFSCSQPEFCGTQSDIRKIENLNGKVEGKGFSLGVQLSMDVATKIEENKEIKFEIIYSTKDSIIMNVINIPNEEFAKMISCIVQDNSVIKESTFAYATFNWNGGSRTLKY
ncbi:MAG: hydroxymethylglutaryl-CoA reductase [Saprospiraceae bacterium]|jgi:hydroxymethylglutaryl-CoA reductase